MCVCVCALYPTFFQGYQKHSVAYVLRGPPTLCFYTLILSLKSKKKSSSPFFCFFLFCKVPASSGVSGRRHAFSNLFFLWYTVTRGLCISSQLFFSASCVHRSFYPLRFFSVLFLFSFFVRHFPFFSVHLWKPFHLRPFQCLTERLNVLCVRHIQCFYCQALTKHTKA